MVEIMLSHNYLPLFHIIKTCPAKITQSVSRPSGHAKLHNKRFAHCLLNHSIIREDMEKRLSPFWNPSFETCLKFDKCGTFFRSSHHECPLGLCPSFSNSLLCHFQPFLSIFNFGHLISAVSTFPYHSSWWNQLPIFITAGNCN